LISQQQRRCYAVRFFFTPRHAFDYCCRRRFDDYFAASITTPFYFSPLIPPVTTMVRDIPVTHQAYSNRYGVVARQQTTRCFSSIVATPIDLLLFLMLRHASLSPLPC